MIPLYVQIQLTKSTKFASTMRINSDVADFPVHERTVAPRCTATFMRELFVFTYLYALHPWIDVESALTSPSPRIFSAPKCSAARSTLIQIQIGLLPSELLRMAWLIMIDTRTRRRWSKLNARFSSQNGLSCLQNTWFACQLLFVLILKPDVLPRTGSAAIATRGVADSLRLLLRIFPQDLPNQNLEGVSVKAILGLDLSQAAQVCCLRS